MRNWLTQSIRSFVLCNSMGVTPWMTNILSGEFLLTGRTKSIKTMLWQGETKLSIGNIIIHTLCIAFYTLYFVCLHVKASLLIKPTWNWASKSFHITYYLITVSSYIIILLPQWKKPGVREVKFSFLASA